ncbi:MAG: GDSL family lipase [Lewinellaceae bacterium]|nr:GDSL family lipase [Lewinellaceae bacterium]
MLIKIGYPSPIILLLMVGIVLGCHHSKNLPASNPDILYPAESTAIAYHSSWTKTHYKERIQVFKNDPLHFGDIVFLGNSITEGGHDWAAKFGVLIVKNRGISGDVTDGVLARLDEITFYKPRALFLLIGINDLFNLHDRHQIPSAAYVGNNILKIARIIHRKSPETKIYVQTILPTDKDYLRDNINAVNAKLQQQAHKGYYQLIDLHAAFTNQEGLMNPDFSIDGTHLNAKGYGIWVEMVRPLVTAK